MNQHEICEMIADEAVAALIEEAELTPKPGLVDMANNGAHHDLSIEKMVKSAHILRATFYEMAMLSFDRSPTIAIREQFGSIGRLGERNMLAETENSNTHKGAIWSIGLLCAAVARRKGVCQVPQVFEDAAELANLPDQFIPQHQTNGLKVKRMYGMAGAREEAQQAFPHIQHFSLPALQTAMKKMPKREAKLYTLLVLIANLNDTCIAHRANLEGLRYAQQEALKVLANFSIHAVENLDRAFIERWISPGGSADLLATTLFVINISQKMRRGVVDGKVNVYV